MHKYGQKKQSHLLSDDGPKDVYKNSSGHIPLHKKFTGNQLLLMGSSVIQIIVGLMSVALSVLGLITPLAIATLMSMFGSVLTMLGAYILYDTYKSRASVDNLCREAIHRVIKDHN